MSNDLRRAIAKAIIRSINEQADPAAQPASTGEPSPTPAAEVPNVAAASAASTTAPAAAAVSRGADTAANLVEDPEKTAEKRAEFAAAADALANQPEIMPTKKAFELAKKLEYAMFGEEGATLGNILTLGMTGLGTDESEIADALTECPTLLDVSKVSFEFEKLQGMSLEEALEDELDSRYMNEFVRIPLDGKPLINISGNLLTHRQWDTWVNQNAPQMEKIKADTAGHPNTANASDIAAGATQGATTAAAVGLGGAILVAAAPEALIASSAMVSIGAAAGSVALPVLAGAAIVGGAYALLKDNPELGDEETAALDPTAYKEYTKLFVDLEKYCRNMSKTYIAYKDESAGGGAGACGDYAPLPFSGLRSPVVKNLQIGMNEFMITRNPGGNIRRIAEDNQWGSETSARFREFAALAISGHPNLQAPEGMATDSWKAMSRQLSSTYPGYTPNPKGALAFVIDSYNCDTAIGSIDRGSGSGGSGGGSGGSTMGKPSPMGLLGTPSRRPPRP